MNKIVRFGVSIEEKLLDKFDKTIYDKGYVNRSEAIRDLIRDMMIESDTSNPEIDVIGTLTIVYNHHTREISDKLNDIQHSHHKNIISTTHIHLDQHNCLEVLILKGKAIVVQTISDKLLSVKNVKHGKLVITTVEEE